jgi:hypothetical protein
MRRKAQRITFNSPYESLVYLARRNAAHFCNGPALKLFREALTHARNESEREYCRKEIAALEKCDVL